MLIKRGDLFYVNVVPAKGASQKVWRPVVVIQNDVGNRVSAGVIVAPISARQFSKEYPTNVHIKKGTSNLRHNCTVMLSQIHTIEKLKLEKKIGSLPTDIMAKIDRAAAVSLGLR